MDFHVEGLGTPFQIKLLKARPDEHALVLRAHEGEIVSGSAKALAIIGTVKDSQSYQQYLAGYNGYLYLQVQ